MYVARWSVNCKTVFKNGLLYYREFMSHFVMVEGQRLPSENFREFLRGGGFHIVKTSY